jgi:hypothetical protein
MKIDTVVLKFHTYIHRDRLSKINKCPATDANTSTKSTWISCKPNNLHMDNWKYIVYEALHMAIKDLQILNLIIQDYISPNH